MVKYTQQKQQQKHQLQSLLPPELATLDTPLGGYCIIKGGTFIKGPKVVIREVVSPQDQASTTEKIAMCNSKVHLELPISNPQPILRCEKTFFARFR